jgi:hypothetical protein
MEFSTPDLLEAFFTAEMTEMQVPPRYQAWVLEVARESRLLDLEKISEFADNADTMEFDDEIYWEPGHSIVCRILTAICHRHEIY